MTISDYTGRSKIFGTMACLEFRSTSFVELGRGLEYDRLVASQLLLSAITIQPGQQNKWMDATLMMQIGSGVSHLSVDYIQFRTRNTSGTVAIALQLTCGGTGPVRPFTSARFEFLTHRLARFSEKMNQQGKNRRGTNEAKGSATTPKTADRHAAADLFKIGSRFPSGWVYSPIAMEYDPDGKPAGSVRR